MKLWEFNFMASPLLGRHCINPKLSSLKRTFEVRTMLKTLIFSATTLILGFGNTSNSEAFEIERLTDDEITAAERAWLESDSSNENTRMINEGKITAVDPSLTRSQYALFNKIHFLPDSLQSSQVDFTQCHKNLDAMNAIDIVYNAQTISNLQVQSSTHIGSYTTERDKIELKNIAQGAEICISGTTNLLSYDSQTQQWLLVRGPYMRKFLDGYYPMHLQEQIDLSATNLSLVDIRIEGNSTYQPTRQETGHSSKAHLITLNYFFEGRLKPTYHFIEEGMTY